MSSKERRQAPRRKTDVALEVFDPEGELIVGVGRLSDVSILGGRFHSRSELTKGQPVRVQFRLGDGERLELRSKIIWSDTKSSEASYGIAFENPTAAQMRQLELWIAGHPESSRPGRPKTTCAIGLMNGDGVGPDVMQVGVRILNACAQRFGLQLRWVVIDAGGDRWLKKGEALSDATLEELRKLDALFAGPIGHAQIKPGVLERELVRKLRFGLDHYVQVLPARKWQDADPLDAVLITENLEGFPTAAAESFTRGTPAESETRIELHTRRGVERCIRYAYDFVRHHRQRKTLTLVDDTDAWMNGHDLWRRVFEAVGDEYTDVERHMLSIGAACATLMKDPSRLDGVVGPRRAGAGLNELWNALQGEGLAAGADIHPQGVSRFYPLQGSLPAQAGRDTANPLGAIVAGMIMLESLGHPDPARAIEKAVRASLASGKIKGMPTVQVGDLVESFVRGPAGEGA